jgi:hypothetical protein
MKGARSKKFMEEQISEVKRTKVAILGTVPHKLSAPFNDLSFDIWAIAHACLGDPLPRVDRIFEIHKEDEWRKYQSALAWQNHPNVPVYMQKVFADVPNSIAFPYDDLIAKFKIFDDRAEVNFTNSISEMMAMAIDEGYKEIHIYGVNMSHHCVAPETMVLMKDLTYKMAGDISVEDEVVAFDEYHADKNNERKFRSAKVEMATRLKEPCYKLTFEDGTEIICSAKHRWLVGCEKLYWLETEKLIAKGDYVDGRCSHVVKPLERWDTERGYEAGYLSASVDGEGNLNQRGKKHPSGNYNSCSIGFAQKDNKMLSAFLEYCDKLGFHFSGKRDITGCNKLQLTTRKDVVRFLGSMRPKRLLEKFDIDLLGRLTGSKVALVKKEFLGERDVIALKTTTGTFIAEGFASHNSEYGTQKPSCEYYLGLAKGMGIKIYVPPVSDLIKTNFIYGRDEEEQALMIAKIEDRLNFLNQQLNTYQMQANQVQAAIQQHLGAIEDCKFWLQHFKQ